MLINIVFMCPIVENIAYLLNKYITINYKIVCWLISFLYTSVFVKS